MCVWGTRAPPINPRCCPCSRWNVLDSIAWRALTALYGIPISKYVKAHSKCSHYSKTAENIPTQTNLNESAKVHLQPRCDNNNNNSESRLQNNRVPFTGWLTGWNARSALVKVCPHGFLLFRGWCLKQTVKERVPVDPDAGTALNK